MKRFLLLFLLLNFAGIPWSFSLLAYNQPPDTSITGAVRQTISIEELEQQRLEEQEARQRLQSQIEQLQLSDSQKREELEKLIEALDAREAQLLEVATNRAKKRCVILPSATLFLGHSTIRYLQSTRGLVQPIHVTGPPELAKEFANFSPKTFFDATHS